VVIRELSDVETMEIAIIENLQREDLNPIEEAEGLQALIDRCGFTQDQVAASVGKSRPAIANSLRLLKLPPEVREMTKSGAISAGHARALLGLPNEALIYAAAEQIVSHKLTVRDVEKLAKRSQQEAGAAPKPRSRRDAFYDEVELALKETLGRKVRVVPGRGKGTLQVLNNGDLHGLHIGQLPDHHRHLSQSGDAAGSVSPLTGHQLVPATGQGPHQKGLQHAVLANTLRQFLQRRFVKGLSWLLLVGYNLL
jgi:hypothetical protein